MTWITEADKMVRTFLPTVLDAAGRVECARELRDLEPIVNLSGVIKSAIRLHGLSELASEAQSHIDHRWVSIADNALFWCEAAIWAAVRKDVRAFDDHVHRALVAIREGEEILMEN